MTADTLKLAPLIVKVAAEVPAPVAVILISRLYRVDAVMATPDDAHVAVAPVP